MYPVRLCVVLMLWLPDKSLAERDTLTNTEIYSLLLPGEARFLDDGSSSATASPSTTGSSSGTPQSSTASSSTSTPSPLPTASPLVGAVAVVPGTPGVRSFAATPYLSLWWVPPPDRTPATDLTLTFRFTGSIPAFFGFGPSPLGTMIGSDAWVTRVFHGASGGTDTAGIANVTDCRVSFHGFTPANVDTSQDVSLLSAVWYNTSTDPGAGYLCSGVPAARPSPGFDCVNPVLYVVLRRTVATLDTNDTAFNTTGNTSVVFSHSLKVGTPFSLGMGYHGATNRTPASIDFFATPVPFASASPTGSGTSSGSGVPTASGTGSASASASASAATSSTSSPSPTSTSSTSPFPTVFSASGSAATTPLASTSATSTPSPPPTASPLVGAVAVVPGTPGVRSFAATPYLSLWWVPPPDRTPATDLTLTFRFTGSIPAFFGFGPSPLGTMIGSDAWVTRVFHGASGGTDTAGIANVTDCRVSFHGFTPANVDTSQDVSLLSAVWYNTSTDPGAGYLCSGVPAARPSPGFDCVNPVLYVVLRRTVATLDTNDTAFNTTGNTSVVFSHSLKVGTPFSLGMGYHGATNRTPASIDFFATPVPFASASPTGSGTSSGSGVPTASGTGSASASASASAATSSTSSPSPTSTSSTSPFPTVFSASGSASSTPLASTSATHSGSMQPSISVGTSTSQSPASTSTSSSGTFSGVISSSRSPSPIGSASLPYTPTAVFTPSAATSISSTNSPTDSRTGSHSGASTASKTGVATPTPSTSSSSSSSPSQSTASTPSPTPTYSWVSPPPVPQTVNLTLVLACTSDGASAVAASLTSDPDTGVLLREQVAAAAFNSSAGGNVTAAAGLVGYVVITGLSDASSGEVLATFSLSDPINGGGGTRRVLQRFPSPSLTTVQEGERISTAYDSGRGLTTVYGIVVDLQILIPWSLLLSAALNKTPLPTTPGVGYDMAALLAAQYALVSEVGTSLGGAVASDVSLMTLLAPLLEKVAVDAGVPLLSLGLTGIVMLPAPTPTPTPLCVDVLPPVVPLNATIGLVSLSWMPPAAGDTNVTITFRFPATDGWFGFGIRSGTGMVGSDIWLMTGGGQPALFDCKAHDTYGDGTHTMPDVDTEQNVLLVSVGPPSDGSAGIEFTATRDLHTGDPDDNDFGALGAATQVDVAWDTTTSVFGYHGVNKMASSIIFSPVGDVATLPLCSSLPSPSPTATLTPSASSTAAPTQSPSSSASGTATPSPSDSITATLSFGSSPSRTPLPSVTPLPTATGTASPSRTPAATSSGSLSSSHSRSPTHSPTDSHSTAATGSPSGTVRLPSYTPTPSSTNLTAAGVTGGSSGGTVTRTVTVNNLISLSWAIPPSTATSITITFTYGAPAGWLAFALRSGPGMLGCDAWMMRFNNGQGELYDALAGDHTMPVVDAVQSAKLVSSSITGDGSSAVFTITRALVTGVASDVPFSGPNAATPIAFAWSPSTNVFGYHSTNRLVSSLTFQPADASSSSSVSGLVSDSAALEAELVKTYGFHAFTMAIIWGLVIPASIMGQHFFPHTHAAIVFHRTSATVSASLTLPAVGMAVASSANIVATGIASVHFILGVTIAVLMCLQIAG